MKKIGLAMMVSFYLVGCNSLPTQDRQMPKATYSFTEHQACPDVLTMKVGETLHLSVSENITTGYMWELDTADAFNVEKLYTSDFKAKKMPEIPMPGYGGEDPKVFRLTAKKAGEVFVKAYHSRGVYAQQTPNWSCHIKIQ